VPDGDNIYYVLPTDLGYDIWLGDLTKTNVEDSVKTVLFSVGKPHCLNIVGGWIYYSKNEDDTWKTYRIRTDGTENTKMADFQISSTSIVNDKIYYICGDEILGSQIYSMDLDGTNNERIADGITAVRINVVGDWIYFTNTSAIYKIKTGGTEGKDRRERIAGGKIKVQKTRRQY
jgi:Tol biopolymer transport system component